MSETGLRELCRGEIRRVPRESPSFPLPASGFDTGTESQCSFLLWYRAQRLPAMASSYPSRNSPPIAGKVVRQPRIATNGISCRMVALRSKNCLSRTHHVSLRMLTPRPAYCFAVFVSLTTPFPPRASPNSQQNTRMTACMFRRASIRTYSSYRWTECLRLSHLPASRRMTITSSFHLCCRRIGCNVHSS